MEPIVSKSLPVSLNQHRTHGPIFTYFALEVVRGHDFWTHLKMCHGRFDLVPLILNN